MPGINDIEIRSEELQELIGHVPTWTTRWGISLIASLIVLLTLLLWIIKYPDVIKGDIILTTVNPPIKIVNQASGKLISITKPDGSTVRAGEIFAEIENPISHQGIAFLKKIIVQANKLLDGLDSDLSFDDHNFVFGYIQPMYNDIKKLCIDYQAWKTNNYPQLQITKLKEKIAEYETLAGITVNLVSIAERELQNAEEKYKADKYLYKEGVLTKMDFYREESNFHQKQQSYENLKATLTQNRITRIELSNQLLDLENAQKEKDRDYRNDILLTIHEIENEINNWRITYQLISPIDGKLSVLKPIAISQYLKSGEITFAIIPENEPTVGFMNVPAHGFGKVQPGQRVRIKIDSYPFHEYGQLPGVVERLSQLSDEKIYRAQIRLIDGLKTSYNNHVDFKPEMSGTAEIITEDLRLIERIFYRFREIFQ